MHSLQCIQIILLLMAKMCVIILVFTILRVFTCVALFVICLLYLVVDEVNNRRCDDILAMAMVMMMLWSIQCIRWYGWANGHSILVLNTLLLNMLIEHIFLFWFGFILYSFLLFWCTFKMHRIFLYTSTQRRLLLE